MVLTFTSFFGAKLLRKKRGVLKKPTIFVIALLRGCPPKD